MLTTPLLAAKSLHGHSGAPIGWEKIVMNNVKRICSCDSLNPSMEPTAPCFLWWKKCVSPSGFPLNRPMETPRHVHVHVRSCQFSQGSTPTQCRVATLSGTLKLCSWARWYGASKISFSKTIRNSTSWWVQLLQYVVYCLFGMMMPIVFFGGNWLLPWTW